MDVSTGASRLSDPTDSAGTACWLLGQHTHLPTRGPRSLGRTIEEDVLSSAPSAFPRHPDILRLKDTSIR